MLGGLVLGRLFLGRLGFFPDRLGFFLVFLGGGFLGGGFLGGLFLDLGLGSLGFLCFLGGFILSELVHQFFCVRHWSLLFSSISIA